jgi:hypothetical protein
MIDISYLITIAVTAAVSGWYCYRWGRADGFADGALEGPKVTPLNGGGPKEPA